MGATTRGVLKRGPRILSNYTKSTNIITALYERQSHVVYGLRISMVMCCMIQLYALPVSSCIAYHLCAGSSSCHVRSLVRPGTAGSGAQVRIAVVADEHDIG